MATQVDQEFLAETRDLLDTLGQNLLRYEEAVLAGVKINPDFCNSAFRAAHNIRGFTGMFGKETLSKLAYGLEILLDRLRKSDIRSFDSASVFEILFEALGKLNTLLVSETKGTKNIDRLLKKLQQISVCKVTSAAHPQRTNKGKKDTLRELQGFLTEYEEFRLQENIKNGLHIIKISAQFDLAKFDIELPELLAWLKNRAEIITTLPGGKETVINKIGFEIWIATNEDPNGLTVSLKEHNAIAEAVKLGKLKGKKKKTKKGAKKK